MMSTISNHWWGFENGKRKMHWRSWNWLTTPKFMGGMGFRDMKLFNQAMLGWQCWRLMVDLSSLCARALKGRYYLNGSFMDSSVTRSSSFTWRSLMHGKSLMERGILWRVGDGEDIRIMRDKWIPESPCHPVKPIVDMPDDLRVSALIDGDGKKGNEELVIKYSWVTTSPCCVFWPFTKTGAYTVKSAYIMAKSTTVHLKASVNGTGECSDQICTAKEWKRLWSIKAPPKMKIVLWRFAHNCLPTGQQLRSRNFPAFDLCCHCGRDATIEHTFLKCQYVWNLEEIEEVWIQ